MDCCQKAIEELGAKVDLGQVATIAMSGQLNGLVLLDKDLNPLCNSAIWLDQRATEQADFLTAHYGDSLQKLALSTPGPIHVLSKLLWYKDNQSNLLDRTHKIVFAKDFITLRLAGVCVTDKSDAGAAFMLDLEKRDWAWELLSELGISSSILPSLHESPELVGRVTADCANETGLKAGISVVVGAGDMAALAIGTGVTTPDTACATIGTAGHVAYYQEMVPEQLPSGLFLMCHAVPGKYFLHGLVMTGGYSLTWFVENFVHAENTQTASRKQMLTVSCLIKQLKCRREQWPNLSSVSSGGLYSVQQSRCQSMFRGITCFRTSNVCPGNFGRSCL